MAFLSCELYSVSAILIDSRESKLQRYVVSRMERETRIFEPFLTIKAHLLYSQKEKTLAHVQISVNKDNSLFWKNRL